MQNHDRVRNSENIRAARLYYIHFRKNNLTRRLFDRLRDRSVPGRCHLPEVVVSNAHFRDHSPAIRFW